MKKVYCTVNAWDCPYFKKDGTCVIENPIKECDDFAFFWDEDDDYYSEEEEDSDMKVTIEIINEAIEVDIAEEPEEFDYDFADTYCDIGFNPYMGCYDYDC